MRKYASLGILRGCSLALVTVRISESGNCTIGWTKIRTKTVAGTVSQVTKELLTSGKLSLRTLCYPRRKGRKGSTARSSEESSFISRESFSMMEKKSTVPGSGSTTPFITTTTSLLVWILSRNSAMQMTGDSAPPSRFSTTDDGVTELGGLTKCIQIEEPGQGTIPT